MDGFSVTPEALELLLESSKHSTFFSLKQYYDPEDIYTQGRWELGKYQDNVALVSLKDLTVCTPFTSSSLLSNLITIDIVLEGGVDTRIDHFNIRNNDMPRVVFGSHTVHSSQTRIHNFEQHYKAIGIWIKPKVLMDVFGLSLDTFPTVTAKLLQCKYNRSLLLPITTQIKHCAEELLETQPDNKLKEKFIEAKLTELFCYLIECLHSPEQAFNFNNHLSTRKSHAMKTVLAKLNEDTLDTVDLKSLALEVGMSESNLSRTFKSSYGINVSEYRLQQRLVRAFELLLTGKLTVYQVAMEVGYQDQSSFARAFKKYFGFTPTKVK